MKWKDIKLATLQKMFSAEGTVIPNDDSTKDYIAGMPYVANEALQMICTSKKFILKSVDLSPEMGTIIGHLRKYVMSEMASDFFQFYPEVYYSDGNRRRTTDYFTEASNVFLVPDNYKGVFTVYYKAYPENLSVATEDDYELTAPPDVQVILPLYMASQLYKEDDNGIATSLRNEFEVAYDRLSFQNPMIVEQAYDESGW